MVLRFALFVSLMLLPAAHACASACDDWNALEREIRDNRIKRRMARERIIQLDRELLKEYRDMIGETGRRFPVKGYGPRFIGGSSGNGYRPAGYDFYEGNRHRGHPAHDLFIRDRRHIGFDESTEKPAEIRAFANGVVVAVNPSWQYPSTVRGGIYTWIFNPAEKRFYYYAHLQRVLVAPGDRVKAGDTIALLGRTGKNAWPKRSPTHLHFMCLSFDKGRMTPVNTYRELTSTAAH